jgi:anthranilate synthase component 1
VRELRGDGSCVVEFQPSLDEVTRLLAGADVVPVFTRFDLSHVTPVTAMLALGVDGNCFLLESVEGQERLARWSILGHDPFATIECPGGSLDPLAVLDKAVAGQRLASVEGLDVPFAGGAVGFLSYEAARHYERIPAAADALHIPDAWFALYDVVVVFDHSSEVTHVIGNVRGDDPLPVAEAYARCTERLRAVVDTLVNSIEGEAALPVETAGATADGPANMSREAFCDAVDRCRGYIAAGDIFQVQISRRFALPLQGRPFDVYRALRRINPSPYMFYLSSPHGAVVGASPEMLVRVDGDSVAYHPIAGTRRRGRNASDDELMEAELRGSEKESAEHLMLVDLGRNDLGRVCATGSVRVSELMEVERYSHVMHLVSSIEGRLRPECTALDTLRACFPAGTVTGAPKIRAMEIIAELEPHARGVYAGAVGYLGWGGNLDTAIALRTLLIRDGTAYAQAAAGIVADSTPHEEALEIDNKVAALRQAVGVVNAH